MKKVLIATGVAVLALAMVAGAQGYSFQTNLTVGSTGADVVNLQTWLIANGYHIAAIESGAASKGYFGSQTQAAVKKLQAAWGLPTTGFVGPLTRGKLNAGATVSTGSTGSMSTACPAGFTCTPNPGTVTPGGTPAPVSGPTGITTPGVPGIMTVTAGPISSSVLNVGQQMVPVLTIRTQAQYSDLDVQSMTLDLGPNTAIYNKIFNTIYVTDGTNVLASQALSPSTVVQSGTDYVVGIAGFHFIVPKGTYKDIVIKASLNPSIDSSYVTGGSNVPSSNTVAGVSIGNNWGVGLPANALRSVDGAGLNLYGPTTGIAQALTINKSLVDNAQANVSLDPASPLVASIPVTDTTNGNYLGLPALIFDVNAQNDTLHLHEVKVKVYTTGSVGSVSAAYLYQGSTQITSASVSNGVADFTNITDGTNGASIPVNTTVPFTVKVDVTGVTSGTLGITAGVATSSTSDLVVYNSIDGNAIISGSAQGNTETVAAVGPLITLAGTPTITSVNSTAGNASVVTHTYTATFNINVQAVGTNVMLGLPASTTLAAFGTSTTGVNLAEVLMNSTASTSVQLVASYSQPTNTTLSADGTSFTIPQNQTVTIPVTYSFTVTGPGANTFAVQLQGVNTVAKGVSTPITFMANQVQWRTSPPVN